MLFTNSVIIFWKLNMQYKQNQIISIFTCHTPVKCYKLRGHNSVKELVCKDPAKSDTNDSKHIAP